MNRPSLASLVGRALRLRCPACGAHGLGALLLNLVVAELASAALVLGVVLATWPAPPWGLVLYGGAGLALTAPFVFYPLSKTLWLALDLYFQPQPPEGTARPRDERGAPRGRGGHLTVR